MTNFKMVKEFHEAFGLPSEPIPFPLKIERRNLRLSLIAEEWSETAGAMLSGDLIGIADGLADLLYVVYGTAAEYGIDIDAVFKEVHRSNMSKLGVDGKPILRADGKVLKGPNFVAPNIKLMLDRQFLRD